MTATQFADQIASKAMEEILRMADLLTPHYQYVWDHLLTAKEKRAIGKSYMECRRTIHIAVLWARQRRLSIAEATLDLAERLWLSPQMAERLRVEAGLGKRARTKKVSESLLYDVDSGKLTRDGKVLEALMARAKNCRAVLEAFQRYGWDDWVPNPLANDDPKYLEDSLYELNEKLEGKIRFHVSGAGASWEMS